VKDQAATPFAASEALHSCLPQSEILWISGSDGQRLGARFWPAHSHSPVLIYLHGIEGHSLWFARTAELLQEKGVCVYGIDRRGSGMNLDQRGHVKSYKSWLEDVDLVLTKVRTDHPKQPLFLMANCWGAKLATIVAACDGPPGAGLSGLILTCPAIFTKPDVGLSTRIKIAIDCIFKRAHMAIPMLIPLTTSMFTDNPIYLDYIEKDPLRLVEATPAFFFENFWLGLLAQKTSRRLQLPLLVVQTGCDQIVDTPALKSWFAKVQSADKTFKLFADAAHSIDFDAHHFDEYVALLLSWIGDRVGVRAP